MKIEVKTLTLTMSDEGEHLLTCVTDNENTGDVISELQSTLTDGKALYHKKDYSVAIQKIENVLSSSSNKRLLSEV